MNWVTLALAILGGAGLLGASSTIFRSKVKDELIDAYEKRVAALKEEMSENDRRCTDRLITLEGRVGVLQETFALAVAKAVATEMKKL